MAEPGPLKTCAPRFSQYGARGSLRMRPPSALGALEHDDVAVAQIPGRRETGDAAADHDRVAHGLELAAGGVGGQVAESSAGALGRLRAYVAGMESSPREDLLQRRLTRARLALGALGMLVAVCAIARRRDDLVLDLVPARPVRHRRSRAGRTCCA